MAKLFIKLKLYLNFYDIDKIKLLKKARTHI